MAMMSVLHGLTLLMFSAVRPDPTEVIVLLIFFLQTVQPVLAVLNGLPSLFVLSGLHVPGRIANTRIAISAARPEMAMLSVHHKTRSAEQTSKGIHSLVEQCCTAC